MRILQRSGEVALFVVVSTQNGEEAKTFDDQNFRSNLSRIRSWISVRVFVAKSSLECCRIMDWLSGKRSATTSRVSTNAERILSKNDSCLNFVLDSRGCNFDAWRLELIAHFFFLRSSLSRSSSRADHL